jgi:hypothetical protein
MNSIIDKLVRARISIARLRLKFRRRLWMRGSRKLDWFVAKDALAAAAWELFGDELIETNIFEVVRNFEPNGVCQMIDDRIGSP